jgi:hypothetical protein
MVSTCRHRSLTARDPEVWHIEDGRLYVFFDVEPKQDFLAQRADGIVERAEQHWTDAGN